jgi:hypothetical protein
VADFLHDIQGVPLRFPAETPQHVCGQAIPARKLEAAANRGKPGGLWSAKDNLAGGPPAHPSPATEQKIRALYRTEPMTQAEEQRMADLLLQAGRAAPATAPAETCGRPRG